MNLHGARSRNRLGGAAPDASDAEAIRGTLAGDSSCFEALVRRYNERLFRVGMGYLKSRMDVEDAMQDAYLKAFLKLATFDGRSSFGTWLTRIMINESLMRLRKAGKRETESLDSLSFDRFESGFASDVAGREIDGEEIRALLEAAIAKLPSDYRIVYLLREAQSLSTAEAAACLDISEQNVKVRLHRAREALKSILMDAVKEQDLFAYPARYCDPLTAEVMRRLAAEDPRGAPGN